MSKFRILGAIVGIAGMMVIAAACARGEAPTPVNAAGVAGQEAAASALGGTAAVPDLELVAEALRSALPSVGSVAPQPSTGQTTGIWVTGEGSIALKPDMALLNVGVETFAGTVKDARSQAATSMDAMVSALHNRKIEDRDIQTTSFNIRPQYEFQQITKDGRRTGTQVLVGYTVTNQARIKVRDLQAVGEIIDEVAEAGGDASRINSIAFTVEDTKPFMDDLRRAAVEDALAKARQFASLTGVNLGRLVFITESGGRVPAPEVLSIRAEAAKVATTPITSGELELNLRVQAVFAIQ